MYVKDSKDLFACDALIIPGGESTVISKMIKYNNLYNHLIEYAENHSLYGTCAGAILMAQKLDDDIVENLKLIDVEMMRNAWGRQIHSFTANVKLSFSKNLFKAKFIRAPKVKVVSKNIEILSEYNKEPILLRNKYHLISSFHPELGDDMRVHEYFIKMIKSNG